MTTSATKYRDTAEFRAAWRLCLRHRIALKEYPAQNGGPRFKLYAIRKLFGFCDAILIADLTGVKALSDFAATLKKELPICLDLKSKQTK